MGRKAKKLGGKVKIGIVVIKGDTA